MTQVTSVDETFDDSDISCLSFHYRGGVNQYGPLNPELVSLQTKYLLDKGIFLHDEEARKLLEQEQSKPMDI